MLQQHTHLDRIIRILIAGLFLLPIATGELLDRTENYDLVAESNGQYSLAVGPLRNIEVNGEIVPVNTNISTSTDPNFEWSVETNNHYDAYFKEDPTSGQVVRYVRNNTEITYQPMALNWINDESQIQQIQMIQQTTGYPTQSRFTYPNAYGTGRDLEYLYTPTQLKANLILKDPLPTPEQYILDGPNPQLELNFVLGTTANQIQIDGIAWNQKDTKTTTSDVYIKDSNGNTLYYLPRPYAEDNTGERQYGSLTFKKQGASLYVSITGITHEWLQNASYPVRIDPTTQIEANSTVTINLSDDPQLEPLIQITLYNVTYENGTTNKLVLDPITLDKYGAEDYAIDPEDVAFEYGTVRVTNAQGDKLFKCEAYNITTNTCGNETGEEWLEIQDLTIGSDYEFNITRLDPGFYEYKLQPTENSTTSATPVTFQNTTFTINESGTYLVTYNTQQRSTVTNKDYLSYYLINGTTITTIRSRSETSDATREYATYGTLWVGNLTAGNHTASIQYSTNGGTTLMKNSSIVIQDLRLEGQAQGYEYDELLTEQTLGLTNSVYLEANITPEQTGDYMILASGVYQSGNQNNHAYVELYEGGSLLEQNIKEDTSNTVNNHYTFLRTDTLTSGVTYNYQIRGREPSAGDGTINNSRLLIIPLPEWLDYTTSTQTASEYTTTSTSFTDVVSLTHTAELGGEYLVFGQAHRRLEPASSAIENQLLVNGSGHCTSPVYHGDSVDTRPFTCQTTINLSAGESINVSLQSRSVGGGSVYTNDASIAIYRITPNPRGLCNPIPGQDWIIDRTVVCDNVTRNVNAPVQITTNGTLTLVNNAQIYANNTIINRWSSPATPYILIERGSMFYAKS